MEIGRRGPDAALAATLAGRLVESSRPHALECLWALRAAGGLDETVVAAAVRHPRPEVRAWAWRLWFDHHDAVDGESPLAAASAVSLDASLLTAARVEDDPDVLCQIASSARRIAAADAALAILRPVVSGAGKADDPRLPLLAWWAIEAKISTAPEAVIGWFADRDLWAEPLVEREILPRLERRFAASGQRADLAICGRLLAMAPSPAARAALLRGFEEAARGRSLAGAPAELLAALAAGGGSLALGVRRGDAAALAEALATLAAEKAPAEQRAECARLLGEVRHAPAVGPLLDAVDRAADDGVRVAALGALGGFADDRVPTRVLARYGNWTEDVRDVAQTLLVGRQAWARALLEAADSGAIDAATLPAETVRKATVFRDERIGEIVRRRFPGIEGASTAEMQAEMDRLSGVLAAGGGDPYRGKKLYAQTCGKCHVLHGVGGRIGPDLTPFRRDDVPRMLHNVVNPSAEIRAGYESHLATTADGRVVQGLLVEEDPQVLVLRDTAGQTVTIERGEIEERRILRTSLMPEGQLKPLSGAEIRDLFAYLRAAQPVVD